MSRKRKRNTPGDTTSNASDSRTISALDCNHADILFQTFKTEFKCFGCGRESSGGRHRCSSCDMVFHKQCKTFKETQDGHKHKYKLRSHKKIFKCDGCKEEGFGKRFRCDQCGHELHTLCKFPKNPGYVIGLTQLPFIFYNSKNISQKRHICGACTKGIDGHLYHCDGYVTSPGTEAGLFLHPCCFNLPHVLFAKLDDEDPHTNRNELKYTLSSKVGYGIKCFLCKHWKLRRPYSGLSYVGSNGKACCHVYCVWEVAHQAWVTAIGHDVDEMSKILENVTPEKLAKDIVRKNNEKNTSFWLIAGKIFLAILKMVASTLMGDPTFGLVHAFGLLFSNN